MRLERNKKLNVLKFMNFFSDKFRKYFEDDLCESMSSFLQATNESGFRGHPVWFPCNFRDTRQSIHQKQFSHTLYLILPTPELKIWFTIWLKDPALSGWKTLYHLAKRPCTIWVKYPLLSGWYILYHLAERPCTIWLKDPVLSGWKILRHQAERSFTTWQ